MNARHWALALLLGATAPSFGQHAVLFDGTSGLGRVADLAAYDLSADFTLEAEMVFDSLALSRQSTILSKMAGWNVENVYLEYSYPENQRLAFGGRGGGVEWGVFHPFIPELGRCYHVAGVRQGDLFSLYLDGELVGQQELAGVGDPSNTGDWLIGQVLNSIRWFPGTLDELRVWDHARGAQEIAAWAFRDLSGQEPGLLACWSLDDGSGSTFADRSPLHHGGTLEGGWTWVADPCPDPRPDLAVDLDGLTGHGVVPDHEAYDLSGAFTLEAEVVFDSLALSRQSAILSKMAGWNVENVYLEYSYPENQRLAFGGRGGGVEWGVFHPFIPELGRCYHVAGVRQGDLFSLYLDGELVGQQELAGVGDPSNPGDWLIGQVLNSIRWFPGRIDEVRVWTVARSQAEILGALFARIPGDTPGLVGCWRFDDGTGTLFRDASPTAQPGLLAGGAAWVEDNLCHEDPGPPAVALSFWLHRRTDTYSGLTAGVTDGPFSPASRTHRVWFGMHDGDLAWHLRLYQGEEVLVDRVMEWPGDRWIQVRVEYHGNGLWRTRWDVGGPAEQVAEAVLGEGIPVDPRVWLTPFGYYGNDGGFLLDDLEATLWDGGTFHVLGDGWEDGEWTQCPQWVEHQGADQHFTMSSGAHGGAWALEGFAGLGVSDFTALSLDLHQGPGPLSPVDDLAIGTLPDLSMSLSWSPVTLSVCGEPVTPDGYVVLYSEQGSADEDFYYLSFVEEPGFVHERVAAFRTRMIYRVVAWSGASLDWETVPAGTPWVDLRRLAADEGH